MDFGQTPSHPVPKVTMTTPISRRQALLSTAAALAVALLAARAEAQAAPTGGTAAEPLPAADTDWIGYGNDLASTRYAGWTRSTPRTSTIWRSPGGSRPTISGPARTLYFNATPTVVKGRLYGLWGRIDIWSAWMPAPGRLSGRTATTRKAGSVPAVAPAGSRLLDRRQGRADSLRHPQLSADLDRHPYRPSRSCVRNGR